MQQSRMSMGVPISDSAAPKADAVVAQGGRDAGGVEGGAVRGEGGWKWEDVGKRLESQGWPKVLVRALANDRRLVLPWGETT